MTIQKNENINNFHSKFMFIRDIKDKLLHTSQFNNDDKFIINGFTDTLLDVGIKIEHYQDVFSVKDFKEFILVKLKYVALETYIDLIHYVKKVLSDEKESSNGQIHANFSILADLLQTMEKFGFGFDIGKVYIEPSNSTHYISLNYFDGIDELVKINSNADATQFFEVNGHNYVEDSVNAFLNMITDIENIFLKQKEETKNKYVSIQNRQ